MSDREIIEQLLIRCKVRWIKGPTTVTLPGTPEGPEITTIAFSQDGILMGASFPAWVKERHENQASGMSNAPNW